MKEQLFPPKASGKQVLDLDFFGTGFPIILHFPLQELQSDGQLLHLASLGQAGIWQFLYTLTSPSWLQVITSEFNVSSAERIDSVQDLFLST